MLGTVRDCFFFQAEDGIRDLTVTGVQTCALPISRSSKRGPVSVANRCSGSWSGTGGEGGFGAAADTLISTAGAFVFGNRLSSAATARSEERRVGKECRSRWSPDH